MRVLTQSPLGNEGWTRTAHDTAPGIRQQQEARHKRIGSLSNLIGGVEK